MTPDDTPDPHALAAAIRARIADGWDPAHAPAYLDLATHLVNEALAIRHHADPDRSWEMCPAAAEGIDYRDEDCTGPATGPGPCECGRDLWRYLALRPLAHIYGLDPKGTL
jgi:hypothetical protein